MSVSCGVGSVVVLGCMRWGWRRCTYVGGDDSASWPSATHEEFEPVPRLCRTILANYEDDLLNPKFSPEGGYGLNPNSVVKRVTYEDTLGRVPPYMIYLDHDHREIILAIRGLHLARESDYKVLLDNRLGQQMFDGGYVHHGLLKSAIWVLNSESDTLKRLWEENGRSYKMVFAGHSLGAGVAALLTVIVVNHRDRLGGIPRNLIACYAVAPSRCMSLNLAVKYADVIHSIVLQDDFLPRTPTPLEDIFSSIFCLPCLLFLVCMRDTFVSETAKLQDPRRLYAPGRMYHIVERKFCRCGRFPPEVRTAIPVDGRFEHVVLSCNATSDHAIVWVEREAEKALQRLKEMSAENPRAAPRLQKMERQQTFEKEHKDAMERAVTLNIPHAVVMAEEECSVQGEDGLLEHTIAEPYVQSEDVLELKAKFFNARTNWHELVEKLFKKDESGQLLLNRDPTTVD